MNFVTVRDDKGREKEVSAEVWRLMASSKEKGDTRRGHTLVKGKKGPLEKTAPVDTTAAPSFQPDEIAEKVKAATGAQTGATKVKPQDPPAPAQEPPASEEEASNKEAEDAAPANSNDASLSKQDDLTLIEGIGPKVAELLRGINITTFKELTNADPVAINAALDGANLAAKKAQVVTWKMKANDLIK